MKILITGATGLIGSRLLECLAINGHDDIRVLTRDKKKAQTSLPYPLEIYEWDPLQNKIEVGALENVDIVIHLAGENIATERWGKLKKRKIIDSRILSTRMLISEIKKLKSAPKKFISSSAVGIYGPSNDELITTKNILGKDFLAKVCKCWENEIEGHNIPNMKTHSIRTGIVLSLKGGALKKMLPAFKMGIAGKLGSGNQYMSWIHIDDLVGQIIFLINNNCKYEKYNSTAPHPLTNYQFTKNLGAILKVPTFLPVPGFVLKFIFGEMSTLLLTGQKVMPIHFLNEGYEFKFPTLKDTFEDLLKYDNNNEVVLRNYQWVRKPTYKVFSFFSHKNHLEFISPSHLNYKVTGRSNGRIMKGSIINSKFRFFGIPLKWKLKISSFKFGKSFTDEQVYGPCTKWNHQHNFVPFQRGTLIIDNVIYKLPFGHLGKLVLGDIVQKNIRRSLVLQD